MKPEKERFEFKGTLIEPICADCKFNEGRNCSAWVKPRNDEKVAFYIRQRNCPYYEKEIEPKP